MRGSRSRRLALSIASVLFIVGGLFVSLAIYASNIIWPDPQAITYEFTPAELIPDTLKIAEQSNPPSVQNTPTPGSNLPDLVATLRKPKPPSTGSDSYPVITSLAPRLSTRAPAALIDTHRFGSPLPSENDTSNPPRKRVAPTAPAGLHDETNSDHPVSVFSMGTPVRESPPAPLNEVVADLAAPAVIDVVQAMHDADYQLDMQIAALARPIDIPIPPAPPADVFALANTTPQPLPEIVFAMAELDLPPQRVDGDAVLAVSQSLSPPDLSAAPAPTLAAIVHNEPRQRRSRRMITPAKLAAANLGDLSLLPPKAITRKSDEELVDHLAKVLAAIPLPLPGEGNGAAPHSAPAASPRPPQRLHSDPARPPARQNVAEPSRPSTEPTVAVVTPASAPAPASIRWDDGRKRMSVVGIYKTGTAAWALLEMSDGRIIKATKGTSFNGFRVTRIGVSKIWIRAGGMEKGLTTGQVVVLD
ncbi:hypothetical protein J3R80_03825 [Aliiroseovarius sp. Z3]|uniref:hypothetical protein n=1 Tax=Aliiroseovarius sp. Z3 TaxID=2811402 RepID=UPI0023B2A1C9|nr:hypothetical protein [Aliiroseovarius sp. Z3]MDE9449596.1 hypothetical protein [Aliiroseovarius sp. Z3]